jgi:ribonuclease P protein component
MVNFQPTDLHTLRFGWTIPRYVGNATLRNRLKRWGRECLRKWAKEHELSFDINFIFKRRDEGFYRKLEHVEFDAAIHRFLRKVDRPNLSASL